MRSADQTHDHPSPRRPRAAWQAASRLGVFVLALGALSCRSEEPSASKHGNSRTDGHEQEQAPTPTPKKELERVSLLDLTPYCDVEEGGLLLDLGARGMEARRGWDPAGREPLKVVSHGPERFATLDEMQTRFRVWISEPMDSLAATIQLYGTKSERIALYLDDLRLGSARIKAGKIQTVRIRGRDTIIKPGPHRLTIGLSRRRGRGVGADVGWVRLGSKDSPPSFDAASTAPIVSEVTIGEARKPSIVLRRGMSLRCPLWVPPHATLQSALGLWGTGVGQFEAAVVAGNGSRHVLAAHELKVERQRQRETNDGKWNALEIDLAKYANSAIALELSAPDISGAARVALGEPFLATRAGAAVRPPKARRAVVIILSALGAEHDPNEASGSGLPVVASLARSARTYSQYRAPTTSVTGVVATLLTGLQPWQHGVQYENHTLRPEVSTLPERIEAAGGRSAMMTGAPLSFSAFGINRGFERFDEVSPKDDRAATEPLALARSWLQRRWETDGPVLSVIHLRGAHPPFDVPREVARDLAPDEYGGDLEPRRAAIQIRDIRMRRLARHRRMPDEDWERLASLKRAALREQNAAITDFLAWLDRKGDDETLVVLMSDVGSGNRPTLPYSESAPLTDEFLRTLLLLKLPGTNTAEVSHLPVSTTDIHLTIARALGLDDSSAARGAFDLASLATNATNVRPLLASRGSHYAVRLGSYLLAGDGDRSPRLCQPAVDPKCLTDHGSASWWTTRTLWNAAWQSQALPRSKPAERAEDEEFERVLEIWGIPR